MYNNIHIKSKFYFQKGGKLDPDRFTIDGESVLFTGNQTGSMDVKFNKVAKIASRYDKITQDLNEIIKNNSGVPTSKDYNLAVATLVIIKTGIRIGNEDSAEGFYSDYKEEGKTVFAKTYGLTTLLPEHVKISNGKVQFNFTGKKHVKNTFTLSNELSKIVKPIIESGYNPVFNITEPELTRFIKNETSPYLSSKDFRTFRANVYAYQKASELPKPTTKKEWKESVKEVHEYVSQLLNNTPQVVKRNYVDQRLFDELWGTKEEVAESEKENKKEMGGKFYFQDETTPTKRTTYMGEEADKVLGKPLGWSTKNPEESKRLISNLMYQGKLATPAQQLEDASVEGEFEKSTVPIIVNGRVMGKKTLNTKEEAQSYYNAKQAEDSINSAVVDAMPGLGELKSGIEVGQEYYKSGNLDPLLVAGAIPFAGKAAKIAKAGKAARALTRPITITAAAPVAKRIQQAYNLPVSSGKNVKGAYRFSKPTVDSSNRFTEKGGTLTESSVMVDIPIFKHMLQPDKVKKALRETGDESVLFQTNNPMFLRNSQAVEITGDAGEDLLTKGAKMYGGASQVKGEPVKAITNLGTSSKPSLDGLRQTLFGKPTNLSASLIYANKTGGTLKYQSDTMQKFTFKTGGKSPAWQPEGGKFKFQDGSITPTEEEKQEIKEKNYKWLQNWYANRKLPTKRSQILFEEDLPQIKRQLQNKPTEETTDLERVFGRYLPTENKIQYNTNLSKKLFDQTDLHERVHQSYNLPEGSATDYMHIEIANEFTKDDKDLSPNIRENSKYINYFKNQGELHARIMVARQEAGIEPTDDKKTIEDKFKTYLKKTIKSNEDFMKNSNLRDLFEVSDLNGIINMMYYMVSNKKDKNNSNMAKHGGKFTFKTGGLIGNSVSAIKLFKHGGIIAGGVLHSQKNKIGDKGIPVVPVNSYMKSGGKYNKNDKLAEIESSELIFYKETADKIDKLVDEYIDCGCPDKLVQLGKVVHLALKSTTDETCRTQCEFKPKLDKIK